MSEFVKMRQMDEAPLTVLIADGDAWFRSELRAELEQAQIHVVAEAGDHDETIDLALELRPHVCLIDVDIPGGGGVAAAGIVATVLSETSTVLLSSELTFGDVLASVQTGAAGCLAKSTAPPRIVAAVRAVADGESAYPRRELREALGFLVPELA